MSQYVLLRDVKVQNANALSSPFSFGFPAITAFMGFAHALQRSLNPVAIPDALHISGAGVVSHHFSMQDHQEGFNRTLRLTANPLDKNGERPSFVEEGRCHFTVSLVLEVDSLPNGERAIERLKTEVRECILGRMKLAGGDIFDLADVRIVSDGHKGLRQLMPGYALMERRDLMIEAMRDGQDALDALYRFLQIHHGCELDEDGNVNWFSRRAQPGWLVPIATGFQAISDLSTDTLQTRDPDTPHRFAETLVTLGEFVMPCRLNTLAEMIWRYERDGDLYACKQSKTPESHEKEISHG